MNSAPVARVEPLYGKSRPPGPRGRFLVGNLQDFDQDRLGFLLDNRRYGALVSLDRQTFIVYSPRLVKEVLADRDGAFQIKNDFLQREIKDAELRRWLVARRLLNPGLRSRRVHSSMSSMTEIADYVWDNAATSIWIDALPLIEAVTSRTVAYYFFGEDGAELVPLATQLLKSLTRVIGNPWALPPGVPSPSRLAIKRDHRALFSAALKLVQARADYPDLYSDFASEVVNLRTSSAEQPLDRVTNLLVGAMLAAHRVPAAAIGWTLALLHSRPKFAELVWGESRRFRVGLNSETGPASFPTTLSVVLEALRLYPTTWLLERTAIASTRLGGYEIKRGDRLLISPFVVHRDPSAYPNPEEFDPLRWASQPGAPDREQLYIPFGQGPRACPGRNFAIAQAVETILSMFSRFEVSTTRLEDITPDPRTTLLPAGMQIRLNPRAAGL